MNDQSAYYSGFITIVGRPNAGKSTLLNSILGQKLAIVTPKPQTTRDRILGIATMPDCQMVFLDTPGIHSAKGPLNRMMVETALSTLQEADIALLVVDAGQVRGSIPRAEARIISYIQDAGIKTFLVLNKIDNVPKNELLPILSLFSSQHNFLAMIPVCALSGDGVDRLVGLIKPELGSSPQLFEQGALTDRSLSFFVKEFIREQIFLRTEQEIPYSTAVTIDVMEERKGKSSNILHIVSTIHVERKSQKGIIIGKQGSMAKAIGEGARLSIETYTNKKVFLELHVRVEEDWSHSSRGLQKVGYDP